MDMLSHVLHEISWKCDMDILVKYHLKATNVKELQPKHHWESP